MTEREKLIEMCENLILSCKASLCEDCEHIQIDYPHCMGVHFADHLLSNGVIVPPCKVGDTVYYPAHETSVVYETKVYAIGERRGKITINPKAYPIDAITMFGVEFGKTIFLTKSQAEEALKNEQEKL